MKTAFHLNLPKQDPMLWATTAFFLLALILWFAIDHSWPSWDAAEHIHVASQYAQLLHHPRFWRIDWLVHFLSINCFYPPAVYIFNGFLKFIFGNSRWVDHLSLVIFEIILSVSTFALGKLLLKQRRAAVLAVIFINCYPLVSALSHVSMLDFPLLSMVTLSVTCLVWWHDRPSYKRSILLGLVLGLACLTKQIAMFYLIGPCFYFLALAVLRKHFQATLQLITSGIIAGCLFLPWLTVNAHDTTRLISQFHECVGNVNTWIILTTNLKYYTTGATQIISPFLGILLVLAICSPSSMPIQKQLVIPLFSMIIGLTLVCLLPFSGYVWPDLRYIVPAVLYPALITAAQINKLISSRVKFLHLAGVLSVSVAISQYLIFNFTPYPIMIPNKVMDLFNQQPIQYLEVSRLHGNPTGPGDIWGQEWAIKIICKVEGKKPCWLNVMPSTQELNVHTLEMIANYLNCQAHPTTLRAWTPAGDIVEFSEKQISYFDWFLLKTGNQGTGLFDTLSRNAYNQIESYIRNSGHFDLYDERTIADGSKLELYRKN